MVFRLTTGKEPDRDVQATPLPRCSRPRPFRLNHDLEGDLNLKAREFKFGPSLRWTFLHSGLRLYMSATLDQSEAASTKANGRLPREEWAHWHACVIDATILYSRTLHFGETSFLRAARKLVIANSKLLILFLETHVSPAYLIRAQ